VQGVIGEDDNYNQVWLPITAYTIRFAKIPVATTTDNGPVKVIPIQRGLYSSVGVGNWSAGNTSIGAIPFYVDPSLAWQANSSVFTEGQAFFAWPEPVIRDANDHVYMNTALSFIAPLDVEVYIDEVPDTTGEWRLQATYADTNKKNIDLEFLRSQGAVNQEVWGHYTAGSAKQNETGPGHVILTVDTNAPNNLAAVQAINAFQAGTVVGGYTYTALHYSPLNKTPVNVNTKAALGQLTTYHPLTVHLVKEITPIYGDPNSATKGLPYIFYWEADTGANWISKMTAAGMKFTVLYTNDKTKDLLPANMVNGGNIWKDPTGSPVLTDAAVSGAPFGVTPLSTFMKPDGKDTPTYLKMTDPQIEVDYRGAKTAVKVDIFTNLANFTPSYKIDVQPPTVNMRASMKDENDVKDGHDPKTAAEYAAIVKVLGNWTSVRGNELEVEFDYYEGTDENNVTDGAPDDEGKYTMNFGYPSHWNQTEDGGEGDWVDRAETYNGKTYEAAWGQCDIVRNNNADGKVITFYYAPPEPVDTDVTGNIKTAVRSNKAPVKWVNIHNRKLATPEDPDYLNDDAYGF
jgi:hypothetical protein